MRFECRHYVTHDYILYLANISWYEFLLTFINKGAYRPVGNGSIFCVKLHVLKRDWTKTTFLTCVVRQNLYDDRGKIICNTAVKIKIVLMKRPNRNIFKTRGDI